MIENTCTSATWWYYLLIFLWLPSDLVSVENFEIIPYITDIILFFVNLYIAV